MPREWNEPDDDLHICGSCGHRLSRRSVTDRNTRANSRGHRHSEAPLQPNTYDTWKPGVHSYSANNLDGVEDSYRPPPGPPPNARFTDGGLGGDTFLEHQQNPQRGSAGPSASQIWPPGTASDFKHTFPPPPTNQPYAPRTTWCGMTNTPPDSPLSSRSPSPENSRAPHNRPVYPPSNASSVRGSPSSSSDDRHHHHRRDARKKKGRHVHFPIKPARKIDMNPIVLKPTSRSFDDPTDAPIDNRSIAASIAGILGGGIIGRQLGHGDPMATAIGACLGVFAGTFAEHISKNKMKYKRRFGRLKEGHN